MWLYLHCENDIYNTTFFQIRILFSHFDPVDRDSEKRLQGTEYSNGIAQIEL